MLAQQDGNAILSCCPEYNWPYTFCVWILLKLHNPQVELHTLRSRPLPLASYVYRVFPVWPFHKSLGVAS